MAALKIKDLKTCLRIYYENPEIGIPEIMELFEVGETRACMLKKPVREVQVKENIFVMDKRNIHTETAYKVWGIDIEDIERRVKKLEKLGFLREATI